METGKVLPGTSPLATATPQMTIIQVTGPVLTLEPRHEGELLSDSLPTLPRPSAGTRRPKLSAGAHSTRVLFITSSSTLLLVAQMEAPLNGWKLARILPKLYQKSEGIHIEDGILTFVAKED
jgi:hypothetical protein